MKRIGYLHDKIYNIENIEAADSKARKNKSNRTEILKHDENKDYENKQLSELLKTLVYRTSEYNTFKIYEPKERLIFKLPYYPDRITHHAIMNIMEPIWVKSFIHQTYSCIKDRGIHNVATDLKRVLNAHTEETTYCLKMDIKKFYPSINHDILYSIILRKIKDNNLLKILKEIIESTKGVPIGNYLSLFFANLYLSYLDHWIKEELHCKYYFRYADDMVILSNDKNFLRNVLIAIKLYLRLILKLELKTNYQIFPVKSRGIDFVGYKFYHTHILLRKSIKINLFKLVKKYLAKKINRLELKKRILSYFGWLKFCNSKNLLKKIQELTGLKFSNWNGEKTIISNFYNKYIYIVDVVIYSKYFRVNFVYNNKSYYFESKDHELFYSLTSLLPPIIYKIIKYDKSKKNRNKYKA